MTCTECGAANPELAENRCRNRPACEARQMLAAGISASEAAAHAQQRPGGVVEHLKDVACGIGAVGLRATFRTAPGGWCHIDVHHAALMSESRDGWDVTIKRESL